MNVDKHVKVTLDIDGLEQVAFSSSLGWLNKVRMEIDSVDLEDAKASTIKFLGSINPVPYENAVENMEHSARALLHFKELLPLVNNANDSTSVTSEFVTITYQPDYEIVFG